MSVVAPKLTSTPKLLITYPDTSSSAASRSIAPFFFFFNDTATTEIYTLSLHDALPILQRLRRRVGGALYVAPHGSRRVPRDRKSTRLNSSHPSISYAVFCLKKKNVDRQRHEEAATMSRAALKRKQRAGCNRIGIARTL